MLKIIAIQIKTTQQPIAKLKIGISDPSDSRKTRNRIL